MQVGAHENRPRAVPAKASNVFKIGLIEAGGQNGCGTGRVPCDCRRPVREQSHSKRGRAHDIGMVYED